MRGFMYQYNAFKLVSYRLAKKLCVPTLLLIALVTPVHAKRIALLIGNADYENAMPLRNPIHDVDDMEKALIKLGFEVISVRNAKKQEMLTSIRKFGNLLHGQVGLFFFAGHGLQYKNRNFLVPVDADIQEEADIEFETVDFGRILNHMESANNGLNILILDACRDNPFKNRGFTRSLEQRGLVRVDNPNGTLIAYATSPGDVAADGTERNGTFTKHLLWALKEKSHLEVEWMLKEAARKVSEETKGEQIPWRHSSLINNFCFSACMVPPKPCEDYALLLRACQRHFDALRLTIGRGGTAFACYKEVLEKDPNNAVAIEGLQNIEKRYATWIKYALARKKRSKAKLYLQRICKVNPKSFYLTRFEQLKVSCTATRAPFIGETIAIDNDTFHDRLKDGSFGPKMVRMPTFAIGRYKISFKEYDKFADATDRKKPDDHGWGRDEKPVINVSWHDAMAYAEWLSDQTGRKYSLPTDAEWDSVKIDEKDSVLEWTCSEHEGKECAGEKPVDYVIIRGGESERHLHDLATNNIGFRLVRHD